VTTSANTAAAASFSKAEHTVVNVGDAEFPRLITCVKASQGFDWNQGMLHSLPLDVLPLPRFVAAGMEAWYD
jgi:hypothetical protein